MANASAQVPPSQQVVVEYKVPDALPLQAASPGTAGLCPIVPVSKGDSTQSAFNEGLPQGNPVDIVMYSAGPGLWFNRLIALEPEAADSFADLVVRIQQRAQGHPIRMLELVIPSAYGNALRMGDEDALYAGDRFYEQRHLETLQRLHPMFAKDGKVRIRGTIAESLRRELETALGVPVEVNASFQDRKPRPLGTMEAKK